MRKNAYLILLPLLLVLIGLPLVFDSPFFLRIATETIMWIGMAITWDLLAGYTGYLNFGHTMFFGVGAYTTAILMKVAGWAFILTVPLGGLFAGILAFIVGLPTLRLKGSYFAIGTWALALALQQLALILNITGGPDGMRLPPYLNPGYFYYWMLGVVGGTFVLYWILLEWAPFGLKVRAIREDQDGAMALGINPTHVKVQAFVLSAVPVGLLGSIYAYWITFIDPLSALGDILTDQAVVMAVVGGLGTLIGPAIGAVIVFTFKTLFWAYLSDYQVLYLIILGAAIAMTVLFLPNGLWGTFINYRDSYRGVRAQAASRPRIDASERSDEQEKGAPEHG